MPDAPSNFYELFLQTAARFGGRIALEVQRKDSVESTNYAQLAEQAERIAAALAARGLGRGDRAAILAENEARWVAAYLGVMRLGGVAVPLDTNYKPSQVATLLRDSGAKLLFVSPRFLDAGREAVAASPGAELVLLFGEEPGLPSCDAIVAEPAAARLPPCPAVRADAAVLLYSSGTTGDPKGVVLTHGNLIAESESVFAVISINEEDALLGVLPLFHALSQMASLLLPFLAGSRVVYLENLNTTELLRALRERGITIFVCVPQFFYMIHQRVMQEVANAGRLRRSAFRALLAANRALRRRVRVNIGRAAFRPVHAVLGSRMRLLVTGGSRFDPKIGDDLYALGFNIIQAYGLTECSGAATVIRPGDEKLGSVGQALKDVELKIAPAEITVDEDFAATGGNHSQQGEVCIRGAINMQGYWNRPDATAATLRDGWLHTGDLGYLDGDGRLYITGRLKEIIVTSSGKNIYPEEIEAHYLQSPLLKEICVVGITPPGEPAAERLHAVIVPDFDLLREKKVLNLREFLRFELEGLSVKLPAQKRVLSFEIWNEELPRTTTRKLKRFQIAARVNAAARSAGAPAGVVEAAQQDRALSEADRAWMAEPQVARAIHVIRDAARNKDAVHPEASIELELGLDSMERVELLAHLEEEFAAEVPDEIAQKIYTVRELVAAVLERTGTARTTGASATAAAAPPGGDGRPRVAKKPAQAWQQLLAVSLEDDPQLRELLKPRPLAVLFFYTLTRLMYIVARLFFRLEVSGREHLPRQGPFLLCPNHEGYLDPFFLTAALPWRIFRDGFVLGASEYFATPLMAWTARKANIVPVDPDANLVRAMQAGAFGLRHGKILFLFPEGERTADGELKEFKKGAPILAMHLGVPIVPVAFEDVFEFWPRNQAFNWRAAMPWSGQRAKMRFGPAITFVMDGSARDVATGAALAGEAALPALALGSFSGRGRMAEGAGGGAAVAVAAAVSPERPPGELEELYAAAALRLRTIVAALKASLAK